MSSSVFFKFKSQKEPSRVTFDGTGISVFELKRQIIQINRLGDGSDFDLAIYNQDTNDEYDDDTTIIPRSTSIIARRLPPPKPGRGTAARYVSGKMPTNALPNAGRREKSFGSAAQPQKKLETEPSNGKKLTGAESEEERIAAMFEAQSEQWNKTQEQLATATPVYRGGNQGFRKNAAPVPNHPPPAGYVCYRCGEKGHWIQQCPTNADPNYDGRPRVKRTTGIPRSFLKTVEKPLLPSSDDPTMNHQNPTSVMVNAEGEYVVAQPDQASWESYQKKAGTANRPDAPKGNKELQDKGIECSMCHKLMRDAVQTPCCSKVYCEECIQNALLESDFVCPSCDAKEILLDALIEDKEMRIKVEEYKKEKENAGKITDAVKANGAGGNPDNRKSASPPASAPNVPLTNKNDSVAPRQPSPPTAKSNTTAPIPSTESMANKKRPAEEDLGPEIPRGPAAMRNVQPPMNNFPTSYGPQNGQGMYNPATFQQQYPNHGQQAFNNGFNNFGGPPMNGMNPMMMQHQNFGYNGYGGYNPGFNGGYGGPHANFSSPGYNPGIGMEMNGGYGMGSQGFNGPVSHGGFLGGQKMMMNGGSAQFGSGFPNQQKTVFSEPFPSEEDSPYMRKPVNPHRHARPKRIRPSDFKAVGGEMM